MEPGSNQRSRFFRILVALLGFVAGLSILVFLGFGAKFQPLNIKGLSNDKAAQTHSKSKPLFYPSVGKSTSKHSESSKESNAIGKRFTLELQMTNDKQQAEILVDRLAEMGIQAYYTPLQNNGRIVYRVRRGIYPSETLAQRAASELSKSKNINVKVVQLQ